MASDEYGAIHFHTDDLEDAGWESDFARQVPGDLRSGIYAIKLKFSPPLTIKREEIELVLAELDRVLTQLDRFVVSPEGAADPRRSGAAAPSK